MPKYSVTSPSGEVFDVNAPEGASEADAIEYVKKNYIVGAAATPSDPYKETAQEGSNFLAGMGGGMKGLYLGAKQMLGQATDQEIADHKQAVNGLNSTASGMAGNFAGLAIPAAATALIPGANTFTGGALTGAVFGALDPVSGGESRLKNMGMGTLFGLGGQAVASTVGRINQPVRATLPANAQDLASKAGAMGIELNAAQSTGSKPLRWIDSALDNLPMTAEKQSVMKAAQREAWQKKLMEQTGATSSDASSGVMGSIKDRIGQVFNDLSARNTVTLDKTAVKALGNVKVENAKAGPLGSGKVNEVVDWLEGLSKPTGSPILGPNGRPFPVPAQPLEGEVYQRARSVLSKASSDAYGAKNSALGKSLKDLRNALDDAAERSIAPADAAAWKEARTQYGALKAIEKATDPVTGSIGPLKLINELKRKNPNGMIFGKGDQTLPDIAKVGKQFIAENLPDSGTAQRGWYMNMLQNPTTHLGGLTGFLTGGPAGALVGTAAGAATPLAAQRALWSDAGKRYFTNGLVQNEDLARAAAIATQGGSMGLLNIAQ
mgnify:CR=1 FL=1